MNVVARPTPSRKTMSQRERLISRRRSAGCSTAQPTIQATRASVSLPEYGPMPSAPGIHSLPTWWTQALNAGEMSVPWFTAASVSVVGCNQQAIAARFAA